MSYLNLPSLNLANIQKGTISLWFRFSKDSVDAAAAYQSEKFHPEAPGILDSTMPLVTFGRKMMAHVYDTKPVQVGVNPANGEPIVVAQPDMVGDGPCPPSHIGIFCGPIPALVMHFQTDTRANVAGLDYMTIEAHYDATVGSPNFGQLYSTIEDVSHISVGEPESFRIIPKFKINVDKWHHLLVSFDFSNHVDVVAAEGDFETKEAVRSATIKSHCKIWFAFDDENKKGKDNVGNNPRDNIPPFDFGEPLGWVPQDENGIIPQNAERAVLSYTTQPPALDASGNPTTTGGGDSNGEYHWEASPLPMNGGPMGFPASKEYVETIYHCEMAEFQFFSGVVINTGNLSMRRGFVDDDGKPVSPNKKKNPDDPQSYSGSIELLGKQPEVLLHGSDNWQIGYNTGTLGVEINSAGEATKLLDGQFVPTAKIKKFKPEPALTETPTA